MALMYLLICKLFNYSYFSSNNHFFLFCNKRYKWWLLQINSCKYSDVFSKNNSE